MADVEIAVPPAQNGDNANQLRSGSAADSVSRRRATYILVLLMLTNTFCYLDRQLPFILAEAIKRDLSLSDTQLGLLGGAAFMIVYSTVALPMSRLADRYGHARILSGAVVVWSLLTAAGGWAHNFVQLVGSRVGVALGESGAIAPAHAMITQIFPTERRARAMSFYQLGMPLGLMGGLAVGGLIAHSLDWRTTLFILGFPGVMLGILIFATVKIPRPPRHTDTLPVSTWEALKLLAGDPVYRNLVFGVTAYAFMSVSVQVFQAPILIRVFGMNTAQAGLWLGLGNGLFGIIGSLMGGYLGDFFGRRDPRGRAWFAAGVMLLSLPFFLAAQLLADTGIICVILLLIPFAAWIAFLPPIYTAVQEAARPDLRATAAGLMVLSVSLIGSSLGPVVTGYLSDIFTARMGPEGLRVALSFSSLFILLSAAHFMRAAHHIRRRQEATAA